MRQERVSSLKHSCPDEEWEEILESIFRQKTPEGVQATAKVEEGQDADDPPTHLIIEVRRSVQGITVSAVTTITAAFVLQLTSHVCFW